MEGFSRDLLSAIGKGDAPAPPPEQRLQEEVELSLGLSLGGRFGTDRPTGNKPSSSADYVMLKSPVEVRLSSSLPVQAEASEGGRVEGLDGLGSSGQGGGLGVEHAGMLPASGRLLGTTEQSSSSSSVPSLPRSVWTASPQLPSLMDHRTAARANNMGDSKRRLMQEMPSVFTKGLPNGNKVEGFLYKYKKAEDVQIVCLCHGSFLTPLEFVEHAGGGKVDNLLRHIVISPTPTRW